MMRRIIDLDEADQDDNDDEILDENTDRQMMSQKIRLYENILKNC